MKLSFVLPMYNEASRIERIVNKFLKTMSSQNLDCELVIVDDGSEDNTYSIALKLASNGRIKVVRHTSNSGKGFSILMDSVIQLEILFVSLMAMATYRIDQIKDYIHLSKNADIVIGSKKHPQSHVESSIIRKLLGRAFNILVRIFTGLKVSDTQSGIKMFRREAIEKIRPKILVKRFAFDVELLVVAVLHGLRIIETPVNIKMSGLGMANPRNIFRMLIDLLAISYRLHVKKWYQG